MEPWLLQLSRAARRLRRRLWDWLASGKTVERPSARLSVEGLEGRDCPSLVWLGGDGQWSNGGNWLDQSNLTVGRAPTAADDVVFDGNYAQADCLYTGAGGSQGAPIANSLTMTNNFQATLHLLPGGTIAVGAGGLQMDSGDIEQEGGSTLELDGDSNLSGGTINVLSAVLAAVMVPFGKTMAVTKSESTGDSVSVSGTLLLNAPTAPGGGPGVWTFTNGAGISNGGNFNWVDGEIDSMNGGQITNQGQFTKSAGVNQTSLTQMGIANIGRFLLQAGVLLVRGKEQHGSAFWQGSGGSTELAENTELHVQGVQAPQANGNNFTMVGGYLWTDGKAGATIADGDVNVSGGFIQLRHDNQGQTGQLICTNALNLSGTAELDVKIDATNTAKADYVKAAAININQGMNQAATLKAMVINLQQAGGKVPLRNTWSILSSGAAIAGDFKNPTLGFGDGSGNSFTTALSIDKQSYFLKS